MSEHYKFVQNKECEWFPCHSTLNKDKFNCLFCFCPLYNIVDCGGKYTLLNNGKKDCSNCLLPHNNYEYVISTLINKG